MKNNTMTKLSMAKQSDEECVVQCKKPIATVIPESIKPFSTSLPAKCPAITLARTKEEDAFKVFASALQLYKPDEVMFSFNGGKDCTVVLHMLHKFYQSNALKHVKIPVLYIQTDDSFAEIDQFVDECKNFYDINLIKYKGCIKTVLTKVLKEMPYIKAVVMGNRRTDPYCADLNIFQATDPGWPKIMRINPILDWSYRDVWTYIFVFKVPYCVLYEYGYTSIGSQKNTVPNPHLKVEDQEQKCAPKFHPAYVLHDESLERAGRALMYKEDKNDE